MPLYPKGFSPPPPSALPPIIEQRKKPALRYRSFSCEATDLEKQLNERDPDGQAFIFDIYHRGSAVDVIMRFK